ncbi:hypothetical protein N9P25_01920 [Flavobacteriaceae bacterium]|nr:hypothetical protein [Flavobacteriaceae bacterium]
MPQGKGTYGSKVGRPTTKKKKIVVKKRLTAKQKAAKLNASFNAQSKTRLTRSGLTKKI